MAKYKGKYKANAEKRKKGIVSSEELREGAPYLLIFLAFYLVELFAFFFLSPIENDMASQYWPLAFGFFWAVFLSGLLRLLPNAMARIAFGITYFLSLVYAGFQTGYYILFSQMMWLSDFRYASEGADYADVLLTYPAGWWMGILGLLVLGAVLVWKFPVWKKGWKRKLLPIFLAVAAVAGMVNLPDAVFQRDRDVQYALSDYGRSQSAEAAYENMFNAHRLYQICGLYQTLGKDLYRNVIYPLTPGHAQAEAQAEQEIETYLDSRPKETDNEMTGLLKGKNVVLVLMESMDDWMIGEHTPTLCRLMEEGIHFTRFYTPGYGGIRTFNTEFCINTGSFLSSQGGYAFDYVTNSYEQSLANQLREAGYSAKAFHYNDPSFYSRGEFSPAMGYEEYVCYNDYLTETDEKTRKNRLYDDQLLFDEERLKAEFFREGKPTLNFVITRSAHLSYKYNEVLSYWGLKKYPEFRGLTGNEETDCAYLKAKLVDDFFARLLEELEAKGQLENTVIVGVTDHYTYGYKDTDSLLALSGVEETLLLEKTPCFIWAYGLEPMEVDKVLNTSDLLPTMLNLLGVNSPYDYIGHDAFEESYEGFVPFSNGSWICGDTAYDAGKKKYLSISGNQQTVTAEFQEEMAKTVQAFVHINNLILESDYYAES